MAEAAHDDPGTAAFARTAARSAATGAALARAPGLRHAGPKALWTPPRHRAALRCPDRRVPLGLCFLLTFLVLGVAPVVIGLASEVLVAW